MHWLKKREWKIRPLCLLLLIGTPFFKTVGQSVLARGNWYKIAITETGVYKIDRNYLSTMGITVSGINPKNIRIFGGGGKMLPQLLQENPLSDLVENRILVTGEADGKMDENDLILFYGESPTTVTYDRTLELFQHQTNYYSDTTYYFLTIGDSPGLRIQDTDYTVSGNIPSVSEYEHYWYHEKNTTNILKSGREWWGEFLGSTNQISFSPPVYNLKAGSAAKASMRAMVASGIATRIDLRMNDVFSGSIPFAAIPSGTYDVKGRIGSGVFTYPIPSPTSSTLPLQITFERNGQSANAYLDYVALQTTRLLQSSATEQRIYRFPPSSGDTVQYRISQSANNWLLWDITTPGSVTQPALKQTSSADIFTWNSISASRLQTFLGFSISSARVPAAFSRLESQDVLKTTPSELLIITGPAFENEATRLANYKIAEQGISTVVVRTDHIYNEFSSGKPDLTALRNFVYRLYNQGSGTLRYLLLFGDATFDFKNNSGLQSANQILNMIPAYQSRESLDPVYSFSSDDYYGFMTPGDGEWQETSSGDRLLNIGIGRLPVKTTEEAKISVDKIIRYADSNKGIWRNKITFIADDGDGNIHSDHAEELSESIQSDFETEKVFIDAYPKVITNGNQRSPAVNVKISNAVNSGSLILNFTGHGDASGWTQEQILTLSDILALKGVSNPPLWITATCEFGRYDNPSVVSGAELVVLSPKGAAIAALTTTRPVYASTNFSLNDAFYNALKTHQSEARVGDLVRETKNNALRGSLNRNFALLGDPSLALAKPKLTVKWITDPDTLKALMAVRLRGAIVSRETGSTEVSFQGQAQIRIYDKPTPFTTLGNQSPPKEYESFSNILFNGIVTVRNGQFEVNLVMPKNIDYRYGSGLASVYAVTGDSLLDAGGQLSLIIGGSASPVADLTPPEIKAWLNYPDFTNGSTVEPDSRLFVRLKDAGGINLSSTGIGQELSITLNDSLVIPLSSYYTADRDDFTQGMVEYNLTELPEGMYAGVIKARDVYNNTAEYTLTFRVGKRSGVRIVSDGIYPNPFSDNLNYKIEHNREGDDLEVDFTLFTLLGQKVYSAKKTYYQVSSGLEESFPMKIVNSLASGSPTVYLYQLVVRSLSDSSTATISGRLIRQH